MRATLELADEEPCGCGSGELYGSCCKHERAQFVRDKRGRVSRQVALVPEAVEALQQAKAEFKRAFGRNPGRGDRIFAGAAFRHSPMDMRRTFESAALQAGCPKELIFAYRETDGLMLTEDTFEMASPADREMWVDAIEDYRDAAEEGIDLLEDTGPVALALEVFGKFLNDAVTHLGSYADRAPRRVKRDLAVFFQFLLVSQCHQSLKRLADAWDEGIGEEAFPLLRTIYECTLLMARLDAEPKYADTLLAQALAGSELFPYRSRKQGGPDYSTIIDLHAGTRHKARNSFAECAKVKGDDAEAFFEILYPELSSKIHFHSLDLLQRYRETGSFVIWKEHGKETFAILTAVVIQYLANQIAATGSATKILRRDSTLLKRRALGALSAVLCALDTEGRDVDETLLVLTFAAMHHFKLPT